MVKAKFYKMKNINGMLFATVKILSPKKIDHWSLKIDSMRISEYSKLYPIFVGQEQSHKDSLYVATNQERVWEKGHIGYFNEIDFDDIEATLTPEEKQITLKSREGWRERELIYAKKHYPKLEITPNIGRGLLTDEQFAIVKNFINEHKRNLTIEEYNEMIYDNTLTDDEMRMMKLFGHVDFGKSV